MLSAFGGPSGFSALRDTIYLSIKAYRYENVKKDLPAGDIYK